MLVEAPAEWQENESYIDLSPASRHACARGESQSNCNHASQCNTASSLMKK